MSDLKHSAQSQASVLVPWVIALVNGFAPFIISVLIILPLWLAKVGVPLFFPPLYIAISVALLLIFFLGTFLGRIAGITWFRSGAQTLIVATVVVALIYFFTG